MIWKKYMLGQYNINIVHGPLIPCNTPLLSCLAHRCIKIARPGFSPCLHCTSNIYCSILPTVIAHKFQFNPPHLPLHLWPRSSEYTVIIKWQALYLNPEAPSTLLISLPLLFHLLMPFIGPCHHYTPVTSRYMVISARQINILAQIGN